MQMLRPILGVALLLTFVTSCTESPPVVLVQSDLSRDVKAQLYIIKDDPPLLGLKVTHPKSEPQYYFIASSSYVTFGDLTVRAEVSGNKDLFWVEGSSRFGKSFKAAYFVESASFF